MSDTKTCDTLPLDSKATAVPFDPRALAIALTSPISQRTISDWPFETKNAPDMRLKSRVTASDPELSEASHLTHRQRILDAGGEHAAIKHTVTRACSQDVRVEILRHLGRSSQYRPVRPHRSRRRCQARPKAAMLSPRAPPSIGGPDKQGRRRRGFALVSRAIRA